MLDNTPTSAVTGSEGSTQPSSSQPASPSVTASQSEGGSPREQPNAVPEPSSQAAQKLSAPDPALEAHLEGIPGTLPPVLCEHCKVIVKPAGKGLCPTCGRFLKLSFAARKKPVNTLRVEKLHAELVADYKPTNTVLRSTCMRLARALERLERAQPGTTEWKNCDESARKLSAELDAAKKVVDDAANAGANSISEIRHVIVHAPDQDLFCMRSSPSGNIIVRGRELSALEHSNETATQQPASSPLLCKYGCGSLARCAEIKATRLDVWRAFHALDPEEVERRNREATKEMFAALGRQQTGDPNIG